MEAMTDENIDPASDKPHPSPEDIFQAKIYLFVSGHELPTETDWRDLERRVSEGKWADEPSQKKTASGPSRTKTPTTTSQATYARRRIVAKGDGGKIYEAKGAQKIITVTSSPGGGDPEPFKYRKLDFDPSSWDLVSGETSSPLLGPEEAWVPIPVALRRLHIDAETLLRWCESGDVAWHLSHEGDTETAMVSLSDARQMAERTGRYLVPPAGLLRSPIVGEWAYPNLPREPHEWLATSRGAELDPKTVASWVAKAAAVAEEVRNLLREEQTSRPNWELIEFRPEEHEALVKLSHDANRSRQEVVREAVAKLVLDQDESRQPTGPSNHDTDEANVEFAKEAALTASAIAVSLVVGAAIINSAREIQLGVAFLSVLVALLVAVLHFGRRE